MYFVMRKTDYLTVCTTYYKDLAEWIATRYLEDHGVQCVIRWVGNSD